MGKRNVLLLAILLGIVTSLLVLRFLQQAQARNRESYIPVVTATQRIEPKTVIDASMLALRDLPRADVPRGAFFDRADVLGKVALMPLEAGSPIRTGDVGTKDASLGLAYIIPSYMRAVTVAVDQVIGVAGFLKPGDHVDVIATFRNPGGEPVAKTVLQDVELLALGPQVEEERLERGSGKAAPNKETATLLVTPEDAEKLVLAENTGKLRLALRSKGDVLRVPTGGASGTAVMGYRPEPRSETSPPRRVEEPQPPRYIYTSPPPRPSVRQTDTASTTKTEPAPQAPRQPEEPQTITVIRGAKIDEVDVGKTGAKTK
jgi:pilus assembly protein CpaB